MLAIVTNSGAAVACRLSWSGAGVGGGERTEDLLWLPGHVRVGGAAFMLQDRYDSVGGEIKIAVRVGMVPGLLESGEGEPERGVDVFGFIDREHVVQAPGRFFLIALVNPGDDRRVGLLVDDHPAHAAAAGRAAVGAAAELGDRHRLAEAAVGA